MQDVGCFQVPHPQEWVKAPRRPKDPWCKLIKRNRSSFLTTWPWETPRYSQSLARVQFSPPPFIKAHSQLDTPFPTQTMAERQKFAQKKTVSEPQKGSQAGCKSTNQPTSTDFNRPESLELRYTSQPQWVLAPPPGAGRISQGVRGYDFWRRQAEAKKIEKKCVWMTICDLNHQNKTQIQNDILWHT